MQGYYQYLIASLCHRLSDEEINQLLNTLDSAIYRTAKEGGNTDLIPVYIKLAKDLSIAQSQRNPKQAHCGRCSVCNAIPVAVSGGDSFLDTNPRNSNITFELIVSQYHY